MTKMKNIVNLLKRRRIISISFHVIYFLCFIILLTIDSDIFSTQYVTVSCKIYGLVKAMFLNLGYNMYSDPYLIIL